MAPSSSAPIIEPSIVIDHEPPIAAAREAAPLPPPPTVQPAITRAPARELAIGSTALPGNTAASIFDLDRGPMPMLPPQLTPEQRAQYRPDSQHLPTHNAVTQSDNDASSRLSSEPAARRRRLPFVFLLGGAAAAMVIITIVIFATRGGSKSDDRGTKPTKAAASTTNAKVAANSTVGSNTEPNVETTTETETPTPDTAAAKPPGVTPTTKPSPAGSATATPPAPTEGSGSSVAMTPSPPTEAVATTPAPPTEPAIPPPAPKPAPVKKLGGKKVVLEYDTAAKEPPKKVAAKGDETAAIAAARITYFNGNKRLFAGDAPGAIKLYQQALAVYPGYVAGYRGLGLAYAQKGDKPNALKAFRTYLAAVPAAKDVGLIKKRIAALK